MILHLWLTHLLWKEKKDISCCDVNFLDPDPQVQTQECGNQSEVGLALQLESILNHSGIPQTHTILDTYINLHDKVYFLNRRTSFPLKQAFSFIFKLYLCISQQNTSYAYFPHKKWQANCNCVIWCTIYAPNYNCFQSDPFCLGESLRMDKTSLTLDETSETCRTSLTELSTFGRLRSKEAQACNNPGVADQKQSAMRRQYQRWLLSTCLQYISFLFTKVQLAVQYCKLASYCEAKVTNLKTANHRNMWTV